MVTWVAVVGSSFPYTIETSCIFGYFLSSCFMYPIHAFWLVAEPRPRRSRSDPCRRSAGEQVDLAGADRAVDAWLMNSWRQVGASES